MKSARERVGSVLEDVSASAHDKARGTFDGADVELRLVDRGVGSTRDPWTEVVVLGEAVRADLHLGVIPQTARDARDVAEARLGTDLVLDDPEFDPAFLVEAAPADVVKALLDARVRKHLLALRPVGLHTRSEGLVLEKPQWIEDPNVVRALVVLAVGIARRVPEAFDIADGERRTHSAYRDGPSAGSVDEARRAEVEMVRELKRRRDALNARRGCLLVIGITAFCLIVGVLSSLLPSC